MADIMKCNGERYMEKYAVITWLLFIRFYYFGAENIVRYTVSSGFHYVIMIYSSNAFA